MSAHDLYALFVGGVYAVCLAIAGCVIGASLAQAWAWFRG